MLEQRSYLKNTLEEMDISPVKLHTIPQHLRLVEGKQKLEKHTKLKSFIADTLH